MTREEWLALRRKNVGASEVAALFGCQPDYAMSHWTLWQVKAGRMAEPVVDSPRAEAGLRFEQAAAEWIAEVNGWEIERAEYAQHRYVNGMGCSPDFTILAVPSGILEVKWVDWLVKKRDWGDEPPAHILLQLQHQLACTEQEWGAIGCIVGGNEPVVWKYDRRPKLIAEIEQRVRNFWCSIEEDNEPPIDGSVSTAEGLARLYPATIDEVEDLTADEHAAMACENYLRAGGQRRLYAAAEREARNNLIALMGRKMGAVADGFTVRRTRVAEVPAQIVGENMIGTKLPGREAYDRIYVKEA